jgi:hypothetical protein
VTSPHSKKLKQVEFTLDSESYELQLTNWNVDPGIPDGERIYTYGPGQVIDDGDSDPSLQLEFLSDWTVTGISTFLWEHSGEEAAFVLDHHPDDVDSHVRWTGTVKLKAPPVGGEIRKTEKSAITLKCVGDPVFSRPGA